MGSYPHSYLLGATTLDLEGAFRDAPKLGAAIGAAATKVDPPDVVFTWERGLVHVQWRDGAVYLAEMTAPEPGTATRLAAVGVPYLRKHGITRLELHVPADNEGALYAILAVGFGVVAHERNFHRLAGSLERGSRFDEYIAWKQGKRDEPEWHRDLAPLRPSRRSTI